MTSLSGLPWREQRRFAVRVFRELGYGTQKMENNIKDELSYFLKEIENKTATPVKIHDLLISSVSNNICYFIFGHRFEYNDPMRQRMDFLLDRVPQVLQVTNMVALLPILMKLVKLFGSSYIKETIKKLHEFEDLIDKEIGKHETKLEDNIVDDYLDAYLLEMKTRTAKNEIGSFTRGVLISNAMEFFAAGSETVRTSLEWILMFVAANSNIQIEIHKEIENAIGSNRLPSWSDRELMPFTQSVILETMRWVSIFPLNIPRRAMEDTSVLGHFIPKNTVVIANFWAINRDPKLWTSPEIFDPCRFLSSDRKLRKIDALIPFSFGKRACVGETMAKFELFLYLTTILQSYEVKYADGMTPSFDAWLGLSMQPIKEPLLCFSKINKNSTQ